MMSRARICCVLALALSALLVSASLARADRAYEQVASAYAQAGGHLDACAFSQAELEAALRGIPPVIRNVVPALRRAIADAIAAHEQGACKGRAPEEGTTGGATPTAPGKGAPSATAPPVTTPPAQAAPAVTVPTTAAPAPASTTPAPAATPAQPAAGVARDRDRTPLLVALVAAGALLLLGLLLWGWARLRGWDPAWVARMRHGWGEAGFRATSTWSEFADWLRLGR